MDLVNFFLVLFSVFLNASAQIFIKRGMTVIGAIEISLPSLIDMFLNVLASVDIYIGMGVYAIGIVVWMVVLSRVSVSIAYPFQGIGYIGVTFIAYFSFGEPLSIQKIVGIIIIAIGLVILSMSKG